MYYHDNNGGGASIRVEFINPYRCTHFISPGAPIHVHRSTRPSPPLPNNLPVKPDMRRNNYSPIRLYSA